MSELAATFLLAFYMNFQVVCFDKESVQGALRESNFEEVIGVGVAASGRLFEIYYNWKTHAWSITVTNKDTACLLATGKDWEIIPPVEGRETSHE